MSLEPTELLRTRLEGVRPERGGFVALCPAHDDSRPSLRVTRGDDGRALVCCRAGCTTEAVLGALGLAFADLAPQRLDLEPRSRAPRPAPQRVATKPRGEGHPSAEGAAEEYRRRLGREKARWVYTDAGGEPLAVVLRWDLEDGSKTIRPVSRSGQRWYCEAPDSDRPLYGLDDLGSSGPVLVAEGEKTADALRALGFTATTSMGGARAAGKSRWDSLAGREVFVTPDEDAAGLQYADAVRALCEALEPPARVRLVRLPDLAPDSGEDACDWIGRVHRGDGDAARAALEALLDEARSSPVARPEGGVSVAELAARSEALEPPPCIVSGHAAFDEAQPWGAGVAVGSIVVVGGEVGAGKSRFLYALAEGYARQGLRVVVMLGEMDEQQAWRRVLCGRASIGLRALIAPMPDQLAKLEQARADLAKLQGFVFVRAGSRLETMRAWMRWAEVVFLDPLQTLADGFERATEAERITLLMRELVGFASDGVTVFASSEVSQGNGEERELHNAYRGSSAIKQYATALYFLETPDGGRLQRARCLKQREGSRVELRARIGAGWQGITFERAEAGGHDA
jgi:hypothetical protein